MERAISIMWDSRCINPEFDLLVKKLDEKFHAKIGKTNR